MNCGDDCEHHILKLKLRPPSTRRLVAIGSCCDKSQPRVIRYRTCWPIDLHPLSAVRRLRLKRTCLRCTCHTFAQKPCWNHASMYGWAGKCFFSKTIQKPMVSMKIAPDLSYLLDFAWRYSWGCREVQHEEHHIPHETHVHPNNPLFISIA